MSVVTSLNFIPPVIAHRGASAQAPENTMIAFTKAAQLGLHWIECDVMLTADQQPIVFHDTTLNRTTNGQGYVAKYPYAYLRTLDAGAWFDPIFSNEPIPVLSQVLEFLAGHKMAANIEIKSLPGQEETTVVAVLNEVNTYFPPPSNNILFSSFSTQSLQYLRQYSPTCLLGLLLDTWPSNCLRIIESLEYVSVHINHRILTRERGAYIKQHNKMLLCYTVNHLARAQELYSWGVDAIFSDVPEKIESVS